MIRWSPWRLHRTGVWVWWPRAYYDGFQIQYWWLCFRVEHYDLDRVA